MFQFPFADGLCLFIALSSLPATLASAKDSPDEPLPPGAMARLGTTHLVHRDPISWVGFAPEGKSVLTTSRDQLYFWDVKTGRELAHFSSGHLVPRYTFSATAHGRKLIYGGYGDFKIIDVARRKEVGQTNVRALIDRWEGQATESSVIISRDGRFLAVWNWKPDNLAFSVDTPKPAFSLIQLWDLEQGIRLHQ